MARTILLADDSITIQKVVELTFSDGDYNVVAVSNGAKAIERLPELRPDIILSDIIMPEKNGYEVCEYVKSHPEYRHIPVVLLTGTFEPFDPERAEKAGCDAVVTKPFESQSLIHKVDELIANAPDAAPQEPAAAAEPEAPETAAAPAAGFGGWNESPADPEITGEAQVWSDHTEPAWETSGTSEAPFDAQPPYSSDSQPFDTAQQDEPSIATEPPAFGGFDSGAAASEDAYEPETAASDEPSAFAPSGETSAFAPQTDAFGEHDSSAFSTDSDAAAPFETEQPFDSGATQAFPKMSFDDFQRLQGDPLSHEVSPTEASAAFEPEPEQEAAADLSTENSWQAEAPAWNATPEPTGDASSSSSPWEEESPSWSAPETEESSPFASVEPSSEQGDDGSTRMIPMMSLDEIRRMQAGETSPEDDEASSEEQGGQVVSFSSPFGAQQAEEPAAELDDPTAEPQSDAFGGEAAGALAATGEEPQRFETSDRSDAFAESAFESAEAPADEPFGDSVASPFDGSTDQTSAAWDSSAGAEDQEPAPAFDEGAAWAPAPNESATEQNQAPADTSWAAAQQNPDNQEQPVAPAGSAASVESGTSASISDEQIEKIARRVVELLSEDIIRKIAWEVIPDMAETVVRERIQELEAEG